MRAMRRPQIVAISVAAATILALGSCGDGEDGTPVACLDGKDAYLGALGYAPAEVRLSGEVPISECLAENQPGGELAAVGTTMVAVAAELNSEAREQPGGSATVQLGYLLGAAKRGAESTEGIHADLLRRLDVAARYSPRERPLSPAFSRAYRRGYAAGQDHG